MISFKSSEEMAEEKSKYFNQSWITFSKTHRARGMRFAPISCKFEELYLSHQFFDDWLFLTRDKDVNMPEDLFFLDSKLQNEGLLWFISEGMKNITDKWDK